MKIQTTHHSLTKSYPASRLGMRSKIGTGVLIVGLARLVYGGMAFWIIPTLPPNKPATGRLNSLYVLGARAVASLISLAIRETRVKSKVGADSTGNGISTSLGLLIMLTVVIFFIVAFSLLS